ncbi:unnamed protein product, partial [Adineta ricciae]
MNLFGSTPSDVEDIEEVTSSGEDQYEGSTKSTHTDSIPPVSSNRAEKKGKSSSKPKRFCKFNKEWIKNPQYTSFLQEYRSDSSLAHCSICKSNFSIANGGLYLINRHREQENHKRLAVIAAETISRSIFDFVHPPSQLIAMTAAEITLVYHGVRHGHSYISQSCTAKVSKKLFHDSVIAKDISCGRTKAREIAVNVLGKYAFIFHAEILTNCSGAPYFNSKITEAVNQTRFFSLSFDASNKGHKKMFPFVINYFTIDRGIVRSVMEVIEQPNETADGIVASLREVLTMNNIDIMNMTSIGADNTNVNFGRYHSVFALLQSNFPNLKKGNCFSHVLNNSVKISHQCLAVDVESSLSKLYGHFSSSAKRVEHLKEYFDFVEQDQRLLLQHIKIRWLSLYPSIERLLKVYEPLSAYFLDMGDHDEFTCPPIIAEFLTSTEAKCTLYFLHNLLFDIQKKALELQRHYVSIVDLNRIVSSLRVKLDERLKQNYFGYQTRVLLNSMIESERDKLTQSFFEYISTMLAYIEKYYSEQKELAELAAIFGVCDLDRITFHQIEQCIDFLKMDIDRDRLFDEVSLLRSTWKEVISYREPLDLQIQQHIKNNVNHVPEKLDNDLWNESEDDDNLFHKPTTNNCDKEMEIRSDQFWAFLLARSKPMCIEMHKIVSYVFSIPCSNAFVEGVFSHMKNAWTASRNLMANETIAAELKIRLNSHMKCEDFFSFIQSQPELIKAAR